jgi:steroid 5-alpha reductase family enzyme
MSWNDLWPVLAASAGAAAAWGLLALVLARTLHRNNIVDTLWPLGFLLIAAVACAVAAGRSGDPLRQGLLLGGTAVWALRLGWFVGRRSAGKGDDQRYVDLLAKHAGPPTLTAVRFIFAPQAVVLYIVSLTLQAGMAESGPVSVIGWLGVAVWLLGLAFEAEGDHQMNRFRSDPAHHGQLLDEGLWRWTRHPNYFGDAAVWTGLWLITAERWPGVLTVSSPALMIYLLVAGTGKRLLERSMAKRPGYADYARRTSGFLPVPPRLHQALVSRRRPAGPATGPRRHPGVDNTA